MYYLKTYLKGMAMGAADVVPGVSGGTIAFITGILETLLESINKINFSLFSMLKKEGVKATFTHINGGFLLSLFAGIITSILSLAKLISWLLVNHPIPIWSFFFGLIIISSLHVLKQVKTLTIIKMVTLVGGIIVAYYLTQISPTHLEINTFTDLSWWRNRHLCHAASWDLRQFSAVDAGVIFHHVRSR